jgi:replicative DNA helicase
MKSNTDDYLKYWRVIRQYVKIKYNLTQADLDMILFLYSEKYFDRDKFKEFDSLLGWDVMRFQRLLKEQWIVIFRKRLKNHKVVYQISDKSVNLVRLIYKKLSGEEIPVSVSHNKMFAKNVAYSDKVYREMILEMNKVIKQQRHPSR